MSKRLTLAQCRKAAAAVAGLGGQLLAAKIVPEEYESLAAAVVALLTALAVFGIPNATASGRDAA